VIRELPPRLDIHFTVAGGAEPAYLRMLREMCAGLPVEFLPDVSETTKHRLYREHHVFFSPVDNYQETFGLTVLEAKHHGCVPVVSDWDGYRDLVRDREDGYLLPTRAAPVPADLWGIQMFMPRPAYHGWWAAGVSIDPAQAAARIGALCADRDLWGKLSVAARESARQWSVTETASRFSALIDRILAERELTPAPRAATQSNPFHIDYAKSFSGHPTAFWGDESVELTAAGRAFVDRPNLRLAPRIAMFHGTVTLDTLCALLRVVATGGGAGKWLGDGTTPAIALSIALKNGLIRVVQ
jgi:hypothetical protein